MSNFAGLWRFDGERIETGTLARVIAALDGQGAEPARVWQFGPLAFVHRQSRFTPEDLSEQMPVAGSSGSVLVADLRLDRRSDLHRDIGSPRPIDDSSDAALALLALEKWGAEDGIRRLYGSYALACWDPSAKRLLLGRDPGGFRSLFFYRGSRLLAFSTRLRALLAVPEVPRQLDELALAHHLIAYPGPPERTIYHAIRRVPAGHLAVFTTSHTRVSSWWTPPQPGASPLRSNAQVEEAAAEILDGAVADSLRALGPVTALLTGGLDSASVLSSAARQLCPAPLLALTRVPDAVTPPATAQLYYDESPRAQELAAMYGNVEWRPVRNERADLVAFDEQQWFLHGAAPSGAPVNVEWFFPVYRFMATRNSRTSLSGVVGNSYYSYSGLSLLPELFLRLRWGRLLAHLHALARFEGLTPATIFKRYVLAPFEPFAIRNFRRNRRTNAWAHSALNPAFAAEIRLADSLDLGRYRMRFGGGHRRTMTVRQFAGANEAAYEFWGTLRAITGIDSRAPLNSRRLIEFFGALSLEQFLQDGKPRSLPRRLLAGRAPAQLIANTALGSQNGDWFSRVSARRQQMLTDVERLRSSPLARRVIDLERLRTMLVNWPADVESAESVRPQYFYALTRGMEMARFLAWHEGCSEP